MNCAESREEIATRIVAGDIPPDHCPDCATYATELSALARKLSQLPPVGVRPSHSRWLAALAAAGVLALTLVLALGRTDDPPPLSAIQGGADFEQFPQTVSEPDAPLRGEIDWELSLDPPKEGRFNSPVVDGDWLYLSSGSRLAAFELKQKILAWAAVFRGRTNAAPALAGDSIFMSSFETGFSGKINCFDKKTGRMTWERTLQEGVSHMTPLVFDGRVAASNEGSFGKERPLVLFDARNGRVIWKSAPFPYGFNVRPVVWKETLIAMSAAGTLVSMDAATGAIRWTRPIATMPTQALLLSGDVVVAKTRHGKLFAVRASDGADLWQMEGAPDDSAGAQIAHGHVYAALRPAKLVKVDVQTGRLLWSVRLEGDAPEATPCVTRDAVYIPTGGRLQARSTKDGSVLWDIAVGRFEGTGSRLALHRGVLYGCFEREGKPALVAIR
jgi:outer membrane protein assembly factor BamB